MKILLIIGGYLFGVFNSLPFPWRLRVWWMRFLYEFIAVCTKIFPLILRWTQNQNMRFQMGKQEGEDYESLVMLERVLEYFEKHGVTPRQLQQAVDQAEGAGIPSEQLGTFLARAILDVPTAERVIKMSLEMGRY
jgi:hypothetical protein